MYVCMYMYVCMLNKKYISISLMRDVIPRIVDNYDLVEFVCCNSNVVNIIIIHPDIQLTSKHVYISCYHGSTHSIWLTNTIINSRKDRAVETASHARHLFDKSSEYLVNWTVHKVYGEQDKSDEKCQAAGLLFPHPWRL